MWIGDEARLEVVAGNRPLLEHNVGQATTGRILTRVPLSVRHESSPNGAQCVSLGDCPGVMAAFHTSPEGAEHMQT